MSHFTANNDSVLKYRPLLTRKLIYFKIHTHDKTSQLVTAAPFKQRGSKSHPKKKNMKPQITPKTNPPKPPQVAKNNSPTDSKPCSSQMLLTT